MTIRKQLLLTVNLHWQPTSASCRLEFFSGFKTWHRYGSRVHLIIISNALINSISPLFIRSLIQCIPFCLPLCESAAINM
ncbi:hypothetical protein Bca101_060554 [Brassica carinata]